MTASRTCRACGTDLAQDVMWCLRCYEPVRQLTPRPPPTPTIHFLTPKVEPPTSRWRGGATTFGPVGRLTVTAIVLAAGPWTAIGAGFGGLTLWYAMGYAMIAVVVLRDVWRRERVAEPAGARRPGPRAWVAGHFPRLGRSLPPMLVLGVVFAMVLAALAVIWAGSDPGVRFYLAAMGGVAVVGMFLAVWNEL